MKINIESKYISSDEYLSHLKNFDFENLSIYHEMRWLDAVKNGFKCDLSFVQTKNKDDLIAITPFMNKRKGPISISGTPLRGMYTEFIGCLFNKSVNIQEALFEIINTQHNLLKEKNLYIEFGFKDNINFLPELSRVFSKLGYRYEKRQSIVISLNEGEDIVWNNFQSRARNMIRKAMKSDITAETISPDSVWISDYYEMLKSTFKKQGLHVPHPKRFYEEIINLSEFNLIKCVEVRKHSQIIAASIFVINNRKITYFSGVANKDGMKLAATSLIQWHAMKESIKDDLEYYDMGGLGVDSIDKFKRSFGGYETTHHRWIYRSIFFKITEPILIWLSKKGILSIGS